MDPEQVNRETIFVGGRIRTMDPARPTVEALLLRGDRIAALGPETEVRAEVRARSGGGAGVEVVDLAGGCLLPGFHDAHVHLTQHGLELQQVQLGDVAGLEAALARVAARAAETPAGEWILGSGFAVQRLGVEPDRHMLDRVAPEHPVLLRSQDHHSAWVNSRALERAGVDAATPDPAHGTVVREADGRPSGLLLERALHLVWDRVPEPGREELRAALAAAGSDLAALGVTTVHHMAYEPASYWRELALRASEADYPLRVWACVPHEDIEHAAALGLATGQGGDGFTVGGAKFFADGALGSRTAWMLEPYEGSDSVGVAVDGPEVLAERVPLAIAAGLAPVAHAIGDAANRAVIDALEASEREWRAAGLRPRLEHAQHLHPDDVARLGRLGLVVSMQPLHLTFDAPSIRELLPDRLDGAYRFRSLREAGALLVFGSDTPVAPPDVLAALRAACRRCGVDGEALNPAEALSADEALAAFTRDAARAIGRERRSGRLAPGCDADLVWLSHDPLASLDGLRVRGTLKGGRWTHG